jgi:hypothetical protein
MRKFLSPVLHWDWGLSSWQVPPRNCEVSSCWRNQLANCIRHRETPATDKKIDNSAQQQETSNAKKNTIIWRKLPFLFWRRWWTVTFSTFDINSGVGCKTPSVLSNNNTIFWNVTSWSLVHGTKVTEKSASFKNGCSKFFRSIRHNIPLSTVSHLRRQWL